jgi:hypothetical protein
MRANTGVQKSRNPKSRKNTIDSPKHTYKEYPVKWDESIASEEGGG